MKVLIIGAGFGGINAAKVLAKNKKFNIVIVDQKNYHLFQPFLYQVATAGLSPADISAPIRELFRNRKNVDVTMGEVAGVLPEAREALLSDGRKLSYDKLIIAAGSRSLVFNPDWLPHVLDLKTIPDSLKLRKQILLSFELAEVELDPVRRREYLTFVVIGGGPTGVEMAGAIAELSRFTLVQDFRRINPEDTRIILIEAGPRVLGGFAPKLSHKAKRDLEKLGVSVWLESRVTDIKEGLVELGQDKIACNTIVWAAGVTSASISRQLASDFDIELTRGERLPVNDDLSLAGGPPGVYAIGDIAHLASSPLPGVAPVAIQQGRHVGKELLRTFEGKPSRSFRYVDKGQLATIGRKRAIAQRGALSFSGFFAWALWVFVHIYFLIGFRNRVAVFLQWLWMYVTYKRGARIIN